MTIEEVRKMALEFPSATEAPHFEKQSYKVCNKIFMTVQVEGKVLTLKLDISDQYVYCKVEPSIIHPVPGKWGLKGWTTFYFDRVDKTIIKEAIKHAYLQVAPSSLKKLV